MSNSRLLILDDDPALADHLAQAASMLGFETRVTEDPQHFFDALLAWQPTHVAIDLIMPALSGTHIMDTLAHLDCQAAIILTSGTGSATLPPAQLAAIEKQLNVRGILPQSAPVHILNNLLTESVSVDEHAVPDQGEQVDALRIDADSIAQAIEAQQFVVFYQPQIALDSGKVMGFEALLRWQHPQFGIQLPERFIPIAESTGQIDPLTDIVIAAGFAFIQSLGHDLSFSLNISAKSIKHQALIQSLQLACDQHDLSPTRVILELTETATMQDPAEAHAVLTKLRELGFRLSIDDFGTGYSSMAQLAQLPFTELKIDKSFVTTMAQSPKSRKVVASTLKLAESLGLETIAEGVENTLAAIGLRELGCRYGQGYYFARPMDQAAAANWLAYWNRQF